MIQLYIWTAIFAVLGYFIVTDNSIAEFFLLVVAMIKLNVQRMWFIVNWHIRHNPKNPIVKWHLDRKYQKIAEEMLSMHGVCDD